MSYDDIQRYDSIRGEELNNSRSTTLSTKKFSMYTGLSPKEKIEYHDYNDLRWEDTKFEYTGDKLFFLNFILVLVQNMFHNPLSRFCLVL